MGNGIAQTAARAGYEVVMRDVKEEFLRRGMQAVDKSLQRDVDKERLREEEKRAVVERIRTTTELSHFANPVPVMKLVEVIRGIATSDDTWARTRELSEKMGKTALECNDSPGFVSNRVLMPMINEAVFALHEGVASRESIDGIMKLGMNHPMGPLTLADFIGLDVCLAILNVLHGELGDPKYRPCPLLRKYVDAGWLGRKSGRGFYEY